MTALDRGRWLSETDDFVGRFAERAAGWGGCPGDQEAGASAPWTDPDYPDARLDAAYRSGIVQPDQQSAGDGPDSITVLRARGRRLTKLIAGDGTISSYDAAKHFDLVEIPVDGLDELEEDLRRLLHQPDRCVVRGQIAETGRSRGVRRLLHPEGDDRASLVEAPRRWLALDVDGLPRPANVAPADLAACAGIAISALPREFHDARCIVQATAGHGYKPGLRLRLWHWLDRPVSGAALKCWLDPRLVDHALFGAAQPIFTAAPVFVGGRDPLPDRMVRLPGVTRVVVPKLPEPERRPDPKPVKPEPGLSRYAAGALYNAARSIAAALPGGRDHAINSAAYGIGRLAGAGAVPEIFARRVLHHAAAQIPGYSPQRDGSKVDRSFANGICHPREVHHGP